MSAPHESPAPPAPSSPPSWPRWSAMIVVGLLALAGALVIGLRGGGNDATAGGASDRAETAAYARSLDPVLRRLTDSARVTGRALARAGDASDVARVGRTASQQLAVVQGARAHIAARPAPVAQRAAGGALSRAMQAHQTYLSALSRLPSAAPVEANPGASRLAIQAQRVIRLYRQFARRLPGASSGITSVGLGDLAGLRQALGARARAAEAERQAQIAREQAASEPRSFTPPSQSSSGGPVISRVGAGDAGSYISVSADYCDRTPGAVNEFVYGFEISSGGSIVAQDSYVASQTRACNTISMTFSDGFAVGLYDVVVTIDNLTNAVSTRASGTLSVVD